MKKHTSALSHINNQISEAVHNDELNNKELVKIIELCGSYLNLTTVSVYAAINNISYNGVKKRVQSKQNTVEIVDIFGVKFIIDNE